MSLRISIECAGCSACAANGISTACLQEGGEIVDKKPEYLSRTIECWFCKQSIKAGQTTKLVKVHNKHMMAHVICTITKEVK